MTCLALPSLLLGAALAATPAAAKDVPWRVVPAGRMAVDRAAHQATLLRSGRVLITGGCSGPHCDTVLDSVELYDPASRSFLPAAAMTKPRASHAAARLPDGRVLVAGGWTGGEATASAEIYDPERDRWTPTDDMTAPRASPVAVVLRDGRVFVMGGGGGGLGDLDSTEIYDPATGKFAPAGRMETSHYLATGLADGRVLLTGGQGPGGRILSTAEIYDPESGRIVPTGSMKVARVKHAAVLLADGKVLVVGGSDRHGYAGRLASTEIYDPVEGTFSRGPRMREGRHKIRDAVVVLDSGAVLVAGGAPRPEILGPSRRRFVALEGEIDGPRMFATATLLPGGEVLVAGGYDAGTRPTADAWLVAPGR